VATKSETQVVAEIRSEYKYGFSNSDEAENYFFKSGRGLSHEVVEAIAEHKQEPDWMRKFRHKSLDYFLARPLPTWGGNVAEIDFANIYYYIKPTEKQVSKWEDLPADILDTWDKLGIPEAEIPEPAYAFAGAEATFNGNPIPREGFIEIVALGSAQGSPARVIGQLQQSGVYVTIWASSRKLCLAAARALRRIPT